MKKNNTGITLVALVITIIVLIILAGVSINSVMNGGLIENAKSAKDQFSKTAESETKDIDSLTLKTDMLAEKASGGGASNLEVSKGVVTGIEVEKLADDNLQTVTTVADLEEMLPQGYSILKADGNGFNEEEDAEGKTEKEATIVGTGMQIVKNGVVVSRVTIYGDITTKVTIVYGDGNIANADLTILKRFLNGTYANFEAFYGEAASYMKYACDVNHDGYVNLEDQIIHAGYNAGGYEEYTINQNVEARDVVLEKNEVYYAKQIEKLGISGRITKEWDSTNECYTATITDATNNPITVAECTKEAELYSIKVFDSAGEEVTTGNIQAGYKIAFVDLSNKDYTLCQF